MKKIIDRIASEIHRLAENSEGIIFVAIDGYGGSGKTTVANELGKKLANTRIIHMDDYISNKLLNASPDKLGFDRKKLKKYLLSAAHEAISKNMTAQKHNAKNKNLCIIVEGISSLHPDIADCFDYKIWIDVRITSAEERIMLRDEGRNSMHREKWAASDKAYREKYSPDQVADLIFNNESPL